MRVRTILLAIGGALGLGAGAVAGPADLRLYAIDCGRIVVTDADAFSDDGAYKGVAKSLVVPCYLVRHPKGDLVWDTGLPQGRPQPPGAPPPPKPLADQLKDLGLAVTDIEYVSVSHSHYDHIGGAGQFAASTWIVDPDEKAWAFRAQARADRANFGAYSALENAKTVEVQGSAPHDVFGDGSVLVIPAPGHTPGHTVLLVRLRKAGPVLLTGDLWHIAESRGARRVPRFNFDKAQTLRTYTMVENLAKETGARVVRQHVPEDFEALPKFPKPLQ